MRITVEVKTRANEESVEKIGENRYKVKVKAPPKKGKANKAVLNLLKDYFDRPAWLIGGHTSSLKYIEIES
ncbi:MAG: DUF167 domain-containing protein [Candidatus Bathyarchaeia archaeon]